MSSAHKMISLRSSDGETFDVEEAVAIQSQTIKYMIEDNNADDGIPMHKVTSKTLAKVIEYCKRHVDASFKAADDGVAEKVSDDELKAFDAEFVKVDHEMLFDLIFAANYLNIKSLLDLTCQTVADMIKGKTAKEIDKVEVLDLTPQTLVDMIKGKTSDEIDKVEDEQIPDAKRIRTDDDLVNVFSDSASTLSQYVRDELALNSSCTPAPGIGEDFMIEELVDCPIFGDTAIKVSKDGEIARILEEFLQPLTHPSPHTLHSPHALRTRALLHYYKAKNIWGNHGFIGVLVKDTLPCGMERYNLVAGRKLAEFLMRQIRSDPSFGDVLKSKEPNNMMRSALSIWIGYWSNELMTLPLVDSIGRRALGLNEDVMNEEKTHLASGVCPAIEEDLMVCLSPIADLRQDESIKKLAQQLLKVPEAVKMAEKLLLSLQDDVPAGRLNRYKYHIRHMTAVIRFWFNPLIVVQINKALKELLRCVERVTRIERDPMLASILMGDRAHKIRGALSILFGYWGEIDLSMLLCTLLVAQSRNEALAKFDVTKDKVEVLSYLTVGSGDEEGLKNVLADKYSEDSVEYMDRFLKIRANQEREESKSDYDATIRFITVLLKNGDSNIFQYAQKCEPEVIVRFITVKNGDKWGCNVFQYALVYPRTVV